MQNNRKTSVYSDMVHMLEDDLNKFRSAGNKLAIAAIKVINEYDGLHRLALAVSEWTKTVANEGGRNGEKHDE